MGKLEKRFPHYSRFLQLYPASYQKRYRTEMLQTLADMLDDPKNSKPKVWLRTTLDLPLSLVKENLFYEGVLMKNETPTYIKRNATLSAILLVPFFLALIANALNQAFYHQDLYHSWLWSRPVLGFWVVWLPLAAALITLISLVYFSIERSKVQKNTWLKQLFDVRRNWPVLSVCLIGLFILALVFGHDSVQCVTGNPFREARHWHQTWACIQNPPQGHH